MHLVGTALGDHLDLASGGAVEVSGVVGCPDAELLDTFSRSRHNTRRCSASGCRSDKPAGRRIGALITIHIAGVWSTVQLICILVVYGSTDTSVRSNSGL